MAQKKKTSKKVVAKTQKTTTKKVVKKAVTKKTTKKKAVTKKVSTKKSATNKVKAAKKDTNKKKKTSDKSETQEIPVIKITHDAETLAALNKPKNDLFEKEWYQKKKTKQQHDGPSFSEQMGEIRYERKRKKKKR